MPSPTSISHCHDDHGSRSVLAGTSVRTTSITPRREFPAEITRKRPG
ncbi:hypothetical protein [Amycolatopsis echigonensis]|nr:hypothetical protein [Amycolatopsis niigatensis]